MARARQDDSIPPARKTNRGSRTLYFREFNRLLVFAPPKIAEDNDRIRRALLESKTWGEFRARITPAEYSERFDEIYTNDPQELEEYPESAHPTDDQLFSSSDVPGVDDGDYPLWLMSLQGEFLPKDLLHQYGRGLDSVHNGPFWEIDVRHRESLIAALVARGFTVIERADLEFS